VIRRCLETDGTLAKKQILFFTVYALINLMLAGCGDSFPLLGPVTRIEIHGPRDRHPLAIDNANQISKIVAFVDDERHGWGSWGGLNDIFGTPVPDAIADFYCERVFVGQFGVGSGFFEAQRDGRFVSKSCGDRERQEFLDLLGLQPDQAPVAR
jgi:hypothetical protein